MASQKEIPGLERPVNARVAAAGEAHASAINSHTKATTKRRDTKLELIRVMREEKIDVYVDLEAKPQPIRIDLTSEDNVKVSKFKHDEAEAEKKKKASSKKKPKASKAANDDDESDDAGDETPEPSEAH